MAAKKKAAGAVGRSGRGLSVFDARQLAIAKQTLRMPDAIAGVMGGMTKGDACRVVATLGREDQLSAQDRALLYIGADDGKHGAVLVGNKHVPIGVVAALGRRGLVRVEAEEYRLGLGRARVRRHAYHATLTPAGVRELASIRARVADQEP